MKKLFADAAPSLSGTSEAPPPARHAFTVSELCSQVRQSLESAFPEVWVCGEISGYKVYGQRHAYFSLKDKKAALHCVMFQFTRRYLRFEPSEGDAVLVRGRVSMYEPRGEAQFVVEEMQPRGVGALQVNFEKLKEKLQKEGLFDAARKRALPALPHHIGLVTSLEGAALHDFLRIAYRRNPNLHVVISPTHVQGERAKTEIVQALGRLEAFAKIHGLDVIVVTRGGGSLEDLWPFNEEIVARRIAACSVPVVSAVGHEIDFSISDFVADLRAATPSAAAEMIVPEKAALADTLRVLHLRLERSIDSCLTERASRWNELRQRAGFGEMPRRIERSLQYLSELETSLIRALQDLTGELRQRLRDAALRLRQVHPKNRMMGARETHHRLAARLTQSMASALAVRRGQLHHDGRMLDGLSPLAVLGRGYSLCFSHDRRRILRSASDVEVSESVFIRLAKGELECDVRRKFISPPSEHAL